jgi:hypothetical protein
MRELLLLSVLAGMKVWAETPQYGGDLNVGTVNVTLSPLSWDPADWTWKSNHDTGAAREQLFAGDLDKSIRKGGAYPFIADAYLPSESIRGELAESWSWEGDLTLVINLRRNALFTDRPGVMKARLLEAEDVARGKFSDAVEGLKEKEDAPIDFSTLSRVELLNLAREKQVVGRDKMKKIELLEALQAL